MLVASGVLRATAQDAPRGVINGDTRGAGSAVPSGPSPQVVGNGGGLSFSIPIVAAAGRNGQTPQIFLGYSSLGAGNGVAGKGWHLNTSFILRQGPRGATTTYTAQDEYVLNLNGSSSKLVSIGDNQFRTEQESFLRVRWFPNYWVVEDKRGTLHVFGYGFGADSSSRQYDLVDADRVSAWYLDRVVDANGNYIVFEYSGDPSFRYPDRIRYNGWTGQSRSDLNALIDSMQPELVQPARIVEFVYEPRPDPVVSYRTGFRSEMSRRLKEVNVLADRFVRTYRFTYTQSVDNGSSLLSSLQEFADEAATGGLPSTTFQYSQNNRFPKWQPDNGSFNPGDGFHPYFTVSHGNPNNTREDPPRSLDLGFRFVDLNGDGCTDIVRGWYGKDLPSLEAHAHLDAWLSDCRGGWLYDDRWAPPMVFVSYQDDVRFLLDTGLRFASLNGDSYVDLAQGFINGSTWVEGQCQPGQTCRGAWLNRGADPPGQRNCEGRGCKWMSDDSYAPPLAFTNFGLSPRRNDDYGVQLVDLDGDGRTDLIYGYDNNGLVRGAYLNTTSGWVEAPHYAPPESFVWWGPNHVRLDLGLRLIDVNGDGLPDIVQGLRCGDFNQGPCRNLGDTRLLRTWLNTGHGWSQQDMHPGPPDYFTQLSRRPDRNDERGLLVGDVNGDGFTDLIIGQNAYLNTGSAWVRREDYDPPDLLMQWIVSIYSVKRGLRMEADFDSDGLVDLLQNYWSFMPGREEGPLQRAWRNNSGDSAGFTRHPDLLVYVKNSLGGETGVFYVPSSRVPNQNCQLSQDGSVVRWEVENPNPNVPMIMEVVGCVGSDPNPERLDGMGDLTVTRYEFSGGSFFADPIKQEFRGFKTVRVRDVASGIRTVTNYLQQDCNKGFAESSGVLNSEGMLFSRSEFQYRLPADCSAAEPPYRNYLARQDSYTCDGVIADGGDLSQCQQTAVEFGYDQFGNPSEERHLGEVRIEGDERTILRTFSAQTTDWIVGLLYKEEHWGYDRELAPDRQWKKLAERCLSYDREEANNTAADCATNEARLSRGNVTGEHAHCFDCQPEYWRTTNYRHDRFGNVVQIKDPRGTVTQNDYDEIYQTFLTRTMRDVLMTEYTYDFGWGVVTMETDSNGAMTSYGYDEFGRKVSETHCDSLDRPALKIEYYLDPDRIAGRSYIVTRRLQGYQSDTYLWGKQIVDGFGRLVQTHSQSEIGTIAVTSQYNSRGLVSRVTLPYLNGATDTAAYLPPPAVATTSNQYDTVGRITRIDNSDGTFNTIEYNRWIVTKRDENGKIKQVRNDAYGQLIAVEERNQTERYTTRYAYDGLGRLIRSSDHAGNQTFFLYDALSHKIGMTDPDMGHWIYRYDESGNLIEQINGRGETVRFEYDRLNRLTLKSYPAGSSDRDVVYTYDIGLNTVGRLSAISDGSGTREFRYDCKGRVLETGHTNCETTYAFKRTYDPQDRVLEKIYPLDDPNDERGERLVYGYNARGLLQSVSMIPANGPEVASPIVSQITYNMIGKPEMVVYSNGVQTEHTYYRNSFRLREINTARDGTRLQYLRYRYDNVGNVTDTLPAADGFPRSDIIQHFEYDDLYRLVGADARATPETERNYGLLSFAYNPIGNITSKDNRTYAYADATHAHAVTSVIGDGFSAQYGYDLNGNLIRSDVNGQTKLYAYNTEDRLTGIVDGAGGLVASYVYNDAGRRVKKITGAGEITVYFDGGDYVLEQPSGKITKYIAGYAKREKNPGREPAMYYFHDDVLGSTSLLTDQNGGVVERAFYKPYGENQHREASITERYRFTGQELDNESDLYYYGARYYDPVLGRFIGADRVGVHPGNPQTLNRYSYVLNNPPTLVDPSGHVFVIPFLASISGYALGAKIGVALGVSKIAAGVIAMGAVQTINVLSMTGVIPSNVGYGLSIGLAAVSGYYLGSIYGGALGWGGAAIESGLTSAQRFLPKWANYGISAYRIAVAIGIQVNAALSDSETQAARLKSDKIFQEADAATGGEFGKNAIQTYDQNPARSKIVASLSPENAQKIIQERFTNEWWNPFHWFGTRSLRTTIDQDWSGHLLVHPKTGLVEFHVDHTSTWKHFLFDMSHPLAATGNPFRFVPSPRPRSWPSVGFQLPMYSPTIRCSATICPNR